MTTLSRPHPEETRLGDYRLLAPLGEGGMGVVHLAQAPDGRRVALKVLRPEVVGDAEARERLAREVRSLQRISSPRIAEILDSDAHGPRPYVVTRYVPGLSLYHHVAEEGTISGPDLLHFADALAEALQAIHTVGVLHRDVKPTNVVMEGRSPVLIDFGLARVAEDSRLTRTGWLLGTPGYLAPEVLYGDEATPAADVHAWAATVAYAATGRSPYGTGPAMAVMDRVRRGQFDLSGIEKPLRELVRSCLSPEPLERPSVAELRDHLFDLRRPPQSADQSADRSVGRAPDPTREQWTMPFAPVAWPQDAEPTTEPVSAPEEPVTAPTPVSAPVPKAVPGAVPEQAPATRIMPPAEGVAPEPLPVPARSSRGLEVLQLLGLGLVTAAMIAYAPYAGSAVVGLVALVLRTTSVTRERHGRRQWLRGRRRWYDVPATTLSTPGYLVYALAGTLGLMAFALLAALAMLALGYLAGQPVETGLVLAGLGAAPCLWWGPGSGRVREVARRFVVRNSRREFAGWFTLVLCCLGAAVLVGLLLGDGPNWAPAASGPFH